jgi:hypothetical protein
MEQSMYPQFDADESSSPDRRERVTDSELFLALAGAVQRAHLAGQIQETEAVLQEQNPPMLFIKGVSAYQDSDEAHEPVNIRIFPRSEQREIGDHHIAHISFRLEGGVIARDISIVDGEYRVTAPVVHAVSALGRKSLGLKRRLRTTHRPLLPDESLDLYDRLTSFTPYKAEEKDGTATS